jgi:hypothetical protein
MGQNASQLKWELQNEVYSSNALIKVLLISYFISVKPLGSSCEKIPFTYVGKYSVILNGLCCGGSLKLWNLLVA